MLIIGLYLSVKTVGPAFRGMGYPLIRFSLLELIIGGAVYLRTDKQVAALKSQIQLSPESFKTGEMKRMEKVNRNFKLVKIAEIIFIVGAILLILLFREKPFCIGIGVGLLVQCSFLLAFDTLAEIRGMKYYYALVEL